MVHRPMWGWHVRAWKVCWGSKYFPTGPARAEWLDCPVRMRGLVGSYVWWQQSREIICNHGELSSLTTNDDTPVLGRNVKVSWLLCLGRLVSIDNVMHFARLVKHLTWFMTNLSKELQIDKLERFLGDTYQSKPYLKFWNI